MSNKKMINNSNEKDNRMINQRENDARKARKGEDFSVI